MMQEYEDYLASEAREIKRYRIVLIVMWAVCSIAMCAFIFDMRARAHEAHAVNGDPLGWNFPPECCHSAATHPNGDCSVIPASAVKERPDGYHINLAPGQHPKLKKKGYSTVIPYGMERSSPSGEYAICLADEGAARFCFFAGGKNW